MNKPQDPRPLFRVPAMEIAARITKIQRELQRNEIDGLLIVQRVDLFYFSGTAQNGVLFIPAEGEPLLLVKQYLPRAKAESSIKQTVSIRSIKDLPGIIFDHGLQPSATLALELDVLPVNDFRFYRNLFPECTHVDGSALIHQVRKIKSDWEIAQMRNTADLTRRTFDHMREIIRPGLTELEFAGMFETFARRRGHGAKIRTRHFQTEGYPWHVLSGRSGGMVGLLDSPASGEGTSAAFPVGAGHKKLQKDEPIMVDLGSVLNGYHLDETRMFAIGSMPAKALSASQAVIDIHQAAIEMAKPGVGFNELFEHSLKLADKKGYAKPFLGLPGHKVSFIGHGIGLEIVEPLFLAKNKTDLLAPGMTFALEPKMVFKDEFCAGVESVIHITENGAGLISQVPVEVFIC